LEYLKIAEVKKMVKGAWIVTLREMRCKNWVNGIEVVFHVGENGEPAGSILPLPDKIWEKIPKALDMMFFLYRMRQRATSVFYRAYYRNLLKPRQRQIS
jgi:hypothetical protein